MKVQITYKEYGSAAREWIERTFDVAEIIADNRTICFKFTNGDYGSLEYSQIREYKITE